MTNPTANDAPALSFEELLVRRFSPEVRQWLKTRRDVVGTAIGFRFSNQAPTRQLALLVFVERKLDAIADPVRRKAAETALGDALIKRSGENSVMVDGKRLPVDVVSAEAPEQVIPEDEPGGELEPGGLNGPFRPGSRIISAAGGFGTVTAIASHPPTDSVGIVTCAHVVPRPGLAVRFADGITLGSAGEPVTSIPVEQRWPRLGIRGEAGEEWAVDATFVPLRPEVRGLLEQRNILRLSAPVRSEALASVEPLKLLNQPVHMFGQSTGHRTGVIRALAFEWRSATGTHLFADYLIQHAGAVTDNVSEPGDSGKPAYLHGPRLVAFVWDGARRSLANFQQTTWAAATDAAFAFRSLGVLPQDYPPIEPAGG
jgi:hypothetical protein